MTPERRCVVLILDGLGDRPIPALGGRTPLEAARTPRLDRLAATGRCGLVDPVEHGGEQKPPRIDPRTHQFSLF